MKQRTIFMSLLCAVVCALSTPVTVKAVGQEITDQVVPKVIILELSPESKQSASQEYIVLYNAGDQAVDASGWQVQYRSASHLPADEKGWSTKAIVGCAVASESSCKDANQETVEIAAGAMLRLTTEQDPTGQTLPLASGMALAGGQVRLVGPGRDEGGTAYVYDLVGYGGAKTFEGSAPAVAPKAGGSIVRIEAEDQPQDTNDNAKDFEVTPEQEAPPPSNSDGALEGEGNVYLAPVITEVLPDPASPQTDSDDEFIEFYNPFDESIDLDGYTLVTGASWARTYVIQDVTLEPGGYVSLASSATNISLSNSGTGIRLLDPSGALLFEVPSYGKAVAGSSWAQGAGGQWVWTSQSTPGAPNVIVEPPVKASTTATAAAAKKASTTKAKATAAKSSSTKKAASNTTKTTAKAPGEGAAVSKQQAPMNYMVLAIAAAVAGGYVLYEYRRDIAAYSRTSWLRIKGVFAGK